MNPPLEDHIVAGNPTLRDAFNRPISDLRISVIDRCNFRCPYCMPSGKYSKKYHFLNKQDWLTFDEIVRLVRIFTQCGVQKIRLTGGEPLLRPHLDQLIQSLSEIDAITDLALTTNASMLYEQAELLRNAGLKRLTVSLDSLDNKTFTEMSGGKGILKDIKEGVREAERVGFTQIKFNCVVQKGVNDHAILDLVEYARSRNHVMRFIEYMDVGTCNHWDERSVLPASAMVTLINKHYPIEPVDPNYYGEVANRYRFKDGGGEIGFISSISQPFCRSCTRARLSTDGKFYTCLFAHEGKDLRTLIRNESSDEEILTVLKSIWTQRNDRYSELRSQSSQQHTSPKIEMYQIGG